MKKIAVIEISFIDRYLKRFVEICNEHGISVDLLTFEKDSEFSKYCNKTYYLKSKYNSKDVKSVKIIEEEIKSLINIDEYDFIISNTMALSFCCNVFHYLSLQEKLSFHSNFLYRTITKIAHIKRIEHEKYYYKNCPKIVVVSSILKEDYARNCHIPDEKFIVIPAGTSSDNNQDVKPKLKTQGEFVIGADTRNFKTKGGYNILKAVRLFKKRNKDIKIKCRFINPKHKKQIFLKLLINFYGLNKNVEFLGYQNDMDKFYKSLDCFVSASRYEAFGMVVTEAMLSDTPVVIASNIGASDVIEDGKNGFIADKNDLTRNLVEKLEKLYSMPEEDINVIKENAHNTAKLLTWENFAEKLFENLYPNF